MLSRTREKGLSFFISANFMTVALVVAHLLSSRPGLQPSASIGISITSISETLQRHPQQFGCTLPSPLMSGYHLSTSLDYELLFCFPNPRSRSGFLEVVISVVVSIVLKRLIIYISIQLTSGLEIQEGHFCQQLSLVQGAVVPYTWFIHYSISLLYMFYCFLQTCIELLAKYPIGLRPMVLTYRKDLRLILQL